jgi:hypothetical protein
MIEPTNQPKRKTEEEIDREWELESIEMRKSKERQSWREMQEQIFQITGQLPGHGIQF